MRSFKKLSLVAAALMASTAMVQAADLIPPPSHDIPPEVTTYGTSGWYIRGDIGYASLDYDANTAFFQGPSLTGTINNSDIDSTWFLQGGIGYQVTDYFRADATLAYYFDADTSGSSGSIAAGSVCNFNPGVFCDFNDSAELSATVLLANAYVDLGTFNGFTPYVGAGVGGAHVKYGDLFNDQTCDVGAPVGCDDQDGIHPGEEQWRFAWAIHAGASYDIDCKWKADAGYTFTRIEGGRAFGFTAASGFAGTQGFDQGIDVHSGRVGLRYALDGGSCHTPPPPEVVYK